MLGFYLTLKQINLIRELIIEKINSIEGPASSYDKLNNPYLQELWVLEKSLDSLPVKVCE